MLNFYDDNQINIHLQNLIYSQQYKTYLDAHKLNQSPLLNIYK